MMLPLQAMQGPENRLQCEKGAQVFMNEMACEKRGKGR